MTRRPIPNPGAWLRFDLSIELGSFGAHWHGAFERPRVFLTGPSGSGKSTFLRSLLGVERRPRGKLQFGTNLWLDTSVDLCVAAFQRRAAWVPQNSLLFPHRTVRQNLAFAGAADADVTSLADALDLTALLGRFPRNLSGGETQRVAIGRALLSRPSLLLLDEAFSAMDPASRARVGSFVREFCQRTSTPSITVAHDFDAKFHHDGEHWSLAGRHITRHPESIDSIAVRRAIASPSPAPPLPETTA